MRARKRGQRMPLGDTWEHRPQGGKYFFWNGKVLTARLQIVRRTWQWPLKVIDEEKAEAHRRTTDQVGGDTAYQHEVAPDTTGSGPAHARSIVARPVDAGAALTVGDKASTGRRPMLDLFPFPEIWAVDFEFGSEPGDNPSSSDRRCRRRILKTRLENQFCRMNCQISPGR
jgi:hypothetical protein